MYFPALRYTLVVFFSFRKEINLCGMCNVEFEKAFAFKSAQDLRNKEMAKNSVACDNNGSRQHKLRHLFLPYDKFGLPFIDCLFLCACSFDRLA